MRTRKRGRRASVDLLYAAQPGSIFQRFPASVKFRINKHRFACISLSFPPTFTVSAQPHQLLVIPMYIELVNQKSSCEKTYRRKKEIPTGGFV